MTAAQQRALAELWPRYGIEFTPQPIDFEDAFGRSAAIVLEIGFGNGDTLVEQASNMQDKNFVGVEVHEPGVGHCLIAARKAGVANLRLIVHDAIEVLDRQIPGASLSRINLYFPDPWPKKRHHKRRIVQPRFIETCAGRLAPGGTMHVATDWADYAGHIDDVFAGSGRFTLAERREHGGGEPLERPMTKFERRGLKQGHRIVDWRFDRNDL